MEGHNVSTNFCEYNEALEAPKLIGRRWKIKWSYVETNTGVLENQIADGLAKKAACKSLKNNLLQPESAEGCWWHAKVNKKTIPQNRVDDLWVDNLSARTSSKRRKIATSKLVRMPF